MAQSALQLAMREMQSLVQNRGVWIALGATGVILGLAGPFGTEDVMRTAPRIAYWLFIAMGSFFIGSLVATTIGEGLRAWGVNRWVAVALAGIGAGLVNFAVLVALNLAVFDHEFLEIDSLVALGVNVIVISIIIAGAFVLIAAQITREGAQGPTTPEPPRLLTRLPLEKRGGLISISVEDHYVDIFTTKGHEMVLMRLSDAMAETGDTPGLQVHRSHWVATDHVASARREGARAVLTLSDGRDIPASRTYVPALKEAGLLP